MPWTIEDALTQPHVTAARRLLGQYEFKLGDLAPLVTIRTYEQIGAKGVFFEQSHFIKIPGSAGPYMTSNPWGDDEAYAVHRAVETLRHEYELAVKAGKAPDDSWLVPNKNF